MSKAKVDLAKMKAKKPAGKAPPASAVSDEADDARDMLEALRGAIGDDNALILGDDKLVMKIRGVISTRCPTLDAAIGRGGVPLGRLTMLHGAEGCGKTTIALQLVAECQSRGGLAVYFDKEYKLDPEYAEKLGVNPKQLVISQPRSLEQVLDGIHNVLDTVKRRREETGRRKPVIVIVDSINACVSKAVLEGTAEQAHVAPEARVWSRHIPKIIERAHQEDVALVFISQVRKKIGVMFGDSDSLAGGESVKFYASLIIKIVRVGSEKEDGHKIANKIEAECKKNQIAPPFKKGAFLIRYGTGVDFEHALILQAEKHGIIKKSGAFMVHDGEKLGQGYLQSATALRKAPDWRDKIHAESRKASGW